MAHKTKESAIKAARKALGPKATEGVDFQLRNTGAGWEHEAIEAANEPAKKARAKKAQADAPAPKARGGKKITEGLKEAAKGNAARTTKVKVEKPKEPKPRAAARPKPPEGQSKTEMVVAMMSTAGGATSKEMEEATGWAPHSVRGLIGGLKKKGVRVESKKPAKGEPTVYRILKGAAPAVVEDVI